MTAKLRVGRLTLACALILCVASVASAQTTWYVDDDAANDPGPGDVTISDPNEDGSLAHPYDAIQEAIDAAVAGDEVLVADGTYTGTGNKNIDFGGKDLIVRSENGANYCTIDCESEGRGFVLQGGETSAAAIEGFAIVNGYVAAPSDGGGILLANASNPRIRNCMILDCYAGDRGGGMCVDTSDPLLVNCLIADNEAGLDGGGLWCKLSDMILVNCTIANNVALDEGGGARIQNRSDVTITNSIIVGNRAVTGRQVSLAGTSYPSTLTISYSNVGGGYGGVSVETLCTLNYGSGMDSDDVVFTDAAGGDYHLEFRSPGIDGGMHSPVGGLPSDDLDGNPRPVDGNGEVEDWTGQAETVDMGAYEFSFGGPAFCDGDMSFMHNTCSSSVWEDVISVRNCGEDTLNWTVVENCDWLSVDPNSGSSTGESDQITFTANADGLPSGDHVCTVQVMDPQAVNGPRIIEITLHVPGPMHVPSDYATIQEALDVASECDEIILADGTYMGTGNKNLDFGGKDLVLRSENGPANCIIDCEDDGRALLFHSGETSAAVVDGLTIINGYMDLGRGGAIKCASSSHPTIQNCIMTDCYADYTGGCIYVTDSDPTLLNCVIASSTSDTHGGGLYAASSDLACINCLFVGNEAEEDGGGVFCTESNATFVNCTIADNVAGDAGGGTHIRTTSEVIIANCIIANNAAARGVEVSLAGEYSPSMLTLSYSCVLGGESVVRVLENCTLNWGNGMIGDDPLFADAANGDYHLQAGSPCIDTGTNTPVGGLPVDDLDGNARPLDGDGNYESWSGSLATADMGAYESAAVVPQPQLCLDPTTIDLFAPQGGSNPDDQTLSIWNCGVETLTWTVTENCTWLSVDPSTGTSSGEVDEVAISFDTTGLVPETYCCELTISSPEASNSPIAVNVCLTVYDPTVTALHVDDAAPLGGDGQSWATAFRYLQDAINAVDSMPYVTEIRIAGGTYYPDQDEAGNVMLGDRAATFTLVNGVTIQGGYRGLAGGGDADELDPATFVTVLSGGIGDADDEDDYSDNTFHVVTGNGVSSSAVLAGVTITLGRADLVEDEQQGGGIYLLDSSAVFTDCIVTGNWLQNGAWNPNDYGNLPLGTGGGIYISDGSPRFTSCEIHDNHANDGNGGTWEAGVNVYAQPGGDGGGVYIADASVEFVDCTIADNTSGRGGGDSGGKPGGHGGGVYLSGTSMATFSRCTITGNSCGSGPGGSVGIYSYDWYAGKAGGKGGGVYIEAAASAEFANCLLAGNRGGNGGRGACFEENDCVQQGNPGPGGAMYGESGATAFLVNCTVADNASGTATGGDPAPELPYGGGIQMDGGTLTVANTVFWGNTAVEGTIEDNQLYNPGTLTIEYSCVEGWTGALGGDGNIGDDPLFLIDVGGGYHMLGASPLVDSGTNSPAGGLPADDLDGNSRPIDGDGDVEPWTGVAETADIGAYECDGSSSTAICTNATSFAFQSSLAVPVPADQVLSISSCGMGSLDWQISEDCDWLTADPMSGTSTGEFDDVTLSIDPNGLSHGVYTCTLLIDDPEAFNAPLAIEITLGVGGELFVPGEYGTIQAAIDAASPGDMITVADGTYTGGGNKNIDFGGKHVSVRSANGPASCVIDCEGAGRALVFQNGETSDCVFEGFTITNGYYSASGGTGIACYDASPTIRNCVITNCRAGNGGAGVYVSGGAPALVNCLIVGNEADEDGGGVYCTQSGMSFVNCTIADNVADDAGGGIHIQTTSDVVIDNCIIANNTATNGVDVSLAGDNYPSALTMSYSCVPGGENAVRILGDCTLAWGDGMIGDDPAFVSADNGYHQLLTDSPCIDAGTNAPFGGLPATDLVGDPRAVDGDGDVESWTGVAATADMGAYESDGSLITAICVNSNSFEFIGRLNDPPPAAQILSIASCGSELVAWQIVEDCAWLTADPMSGESTGEYDDVTLSVDHTGLACGEYSCTLQVTDAQAINSPYEIEITLMVGGVALLVPSQYATIQAAIDAAMVGDEVIVADGTYTGAGNKDLDYAGKDIVVRSENGPAACVIDCEGNGRGVYFHSGEGADAVFAGFTITGGGNVDKGAGIRCENACSPTIVDCILTGNDAESNGGGLWLKNGPAVTMVNCVVCDNTTAEYHGAGILCNNADLELMNCLIVENEAVGQGGGLYLSSAAAVTLTNCTLSQNQAAINAGGVFVGEGTLTLVNTIIADNAAPAGAEIYAKGTVNVDYSNVLGGTGAVVLDGGTLNWGDGMVETDPLFANPTNGDYRLLLGSPCIDGGTNDPPGGLLSVDLDGNLRVCDGDGDVEPWSGVAETVDMGAYEFGQTAAGDFDGDSDLDESDFALFLAAYGTCGGDVGYFVGADLDSDGCITALDYQAWLALYRDYVNDPFAPPPGRLTGDCNRDCRVDLADLQLLLAAYGHSAADPGFSLAADLTGDSAVDLADLQLLLSAYGQTCP